MTNFFSSCEKLTALVFISALFLWGGECCMSGIYTHFMSNMIKKLLCALGLLSVFSTYGQAVTQSKIYICTDSAGVTRLTNLQAQKQCTERVINVPVSARHSSTTTLGRAMSDPQPSSHALLLDAKIPTALQAQRDALRLRMLQSELSQAQTNLMASRQMSQTDIKNSELKTAMDLTIKALQREIARE
jgi:hypothetical protein